MFAGTKRMWLIALAVVSVVALKALLVTSWVASEVEDAAVEALAAQRLSDVEFVEVDGIAGLGADGLDVVLAGPAADRAAAIAAVGGTGKVAGVTYRSIDGATSTDLDDDEDAISVEDAKGRRS